MQTALITGTSKGLGEALVSKFHSEGWFVIGLSRSIEDGTSDRIVYIRGDITEPMVGEKMLHLGIPCLARAAEDTFIISLSSKATVPWVLGRR